MSVAADEINYIIRRYLQEIGMRHTAFVFSNEAVIDRTGIQVDLPPLALVTILKKGMLYAQLEKAINEQAKTRDSQKEITDRIFEAVKNGEPLVQSQRKRVAPREIPLPVVDVSQQITEIGEASITRLKSHVADVYCGEWTSDGRRLATGSGDATTIIWEMSPDGEYSTHHILDHATQQERAQKDIATLSWNPAGTILATGCYDGTARLWSYRGELKRVLIFHNGPIFAAQFSPNGEYLLTGSADARVAVWNVSTGELLHVYNYHKARTLDVVWRDDNTFASCSGDMSVAVCTLGQFHPTHLYREHTAEVNKIQWNLTRRLLASCSDDKTVRIWNPSDSRVQHVLRGHTHHVYTIKWSPSSEKLLASAAFDSTVRLWDAISGTCVSVLSKHTQPIYSLSFSPRGAFLASGGVDNVLYIWSVSRGMLVAVHKTRTGIFEALWNPTGKSIAICMSGSDAAVIRVNNLPICDDI